MSIEDLIKKQTAELAANTAAMKELTEAIKLVASAAPKSEVGASAPAATTAPTPAPAAAPAAEAPAPAATTAPAPTAEAPAPASSAPAPNAAPAAPAPTAEAPAAAPAPAEQMSPEQLNVALVEEYKRLGNNDSARDKISSVFAEFNVPGISHLKPEQYAEVLAKAKALV